MSALFLMACMMGGALTVSPTLVSDLSITADQILYSKTVYAPFMFVDVEVNKSQPTISLYKRLVLTIAKTEKLDSEDWFTKTGISDLMANGHAVYQRGLFLQFVDDDDLTTRVDWFMHRGDHGVYPTLTLTLGSRESHLQVTDDEKAEKIGWTQALVETACLAENLECRVELRPNIHF